MIALLTATLASADEVPTVGDLDLGRYSGTWYELASFPHPFQYGCYATTATYLQRDDDLLWVENRCRRGSLDGPESVAYGLARQRDPQAPGKLEISFFGPFWSDYWVVDLDPDYEWAIVGVPSRDHLWLLSRDPHVDPGLFDDLVARAAGAGFDIGQLQPTVQP